MMVARFFVVLFAFAETKGVTLEQMQKKLGIHSAGGYSHPVYLAAAAPPRLTHSDVNFACLIVCNSGACGASRELLL
jgi:hypothetical protein